ncbi:hypothetical protein [Thauera sp. 63]|uniref:hypothetical protein n=1 Tax=Thauera sp. 63 TaxID=497321 RepID=UPI0012FB8906|nr:hypothetical protein [Thauera sp. 63]
MKTSPHAFPNTFHPARRVRGLFGLAVLSASMLGLTSTDAFARSPNAAGALTDSEGIRIEQPRGDLRRVLISNPESPEAPPARRRLNAEERDALHRDLRDAMRGAYPENAVGRKKGR